MFTDLKLNPTLLTNVQELGYTQPTPVQEETIPPALAGRDVIATAETGSGKTAAFLLPILQNLASSPAAPVRALILCPTREIAVQTDREVRRLGRRTGLRSVAVYGGVGMEPQVAAIRAGADIVVATPGRLLDHAGRGTIRFTNIRFLVLDEADRMLDMGFMPDLRRILALLPSPRQTMLFSATMPTEILALSSRLMRDPVRVAIGRPTTPPETVSQAVYAVSPTEKTGALLGLLSEEGTDSVLVFTRTKHRADRLTLQLARVGVSVARIHGNRSQSQRESALEDFRRGTTRVLVATDIAARGLDIQGVTHVINYDFPPVPEDYIHRIGRTARAGALGQALSLVTTEDAQALREVEVALDRELPIRDCPSGSSRAAVAQQRARSSWQRQVPQVRYSPPRS
jgi:ATP-dependent RNA helicase RhlE